MPGLLRRAKNFVEQHPYLKVLSQKEIESEDDGISEEERRRIAAQIQSVVEKNRITVSEDTFRVRPTKRGGVLVLLVNLAAILLIAGSVYGALWYFDQQEETIVSPATELISAEGLLLETLQEEAEARLSEKDEEIRSIEGRLAEISAERERLASETETIVAEREAAIRAEFEQLLSSERDRLSASGLSEEEVEAEIERLREEQAADLATEIESVRAEAEAEIAEREAAIVQLEAEFEARLSSAEAEREDLEAERAELEERYAAELAAEIEDVRAQAAEETAALEAQRAEAIGALESLRSQREQEEFSVARLTTLYRNAQESIEAGEFESAREAIDGIGAFLRDPAVAGLPTIQRRREVDLFLAETLGELVEMRRRESEVDTASLVQTAALVEAAADLVANADTLLEGDDTTEAERLYRAAINRIPATAVGLERLENLEAAAEAEEDTELSALVSRANTAYLGGDYETAAARYAEVVGYLPIEDAVLYSRLLDTGYQLRAEALRIEQLAAIRDVEGAAAEEVAAAETRIGELERSRAEAEARIEELQATVVELSAALEDRGAELASARAGGEVHSEELVELNARLARAETDAESARERAVAAEERAEEAEIALAAVEERAREAEEALAAAGEPSESPATSSGPSRYAEYVRAYRERYEAQSGAGLAGAAGRRSAIELLETKLLLLRITSSEALREQYPDLYEDTQRLFEDLVAIERADAEEETLAELSATLDAILSERSASSAGAIPTPGSTAADELLREIFTELERLTSG